jgi:hypothetical protein
VGGLRYNMTTSERFCRSENVQKATDEELILNPPTNAQLTKAASAFANYDNCSITSIASSNLHDGLADANTTMQQELPILRHVPRHRIRQGDLKATSFKR